MAAQHATHGPGPTQSGPPNISKSAVRGNDPHLGSCRSTGNHDLDRLVGSFVGYPAAKRRAGEVRDRPGAAGGRYISLEIP